MKTVLNVIPVMSKMAIVMETELGVVMDIVCVKKDFLERHVMNVIGLLTFNHSLKTAVSTAFLVIHPVLVVALTTQAVPVFLAPLVIFLWRKAVRISVRILMNVKIRPVRKAPIASIMRDLFPAPSVQTNALPVKTPPFVSNVPPVSS